MSDEVKEAIEMLEKSISDGLEDNIEIILWLVKKQQDIIKNALEIINKDRQEKIDEYWLYNFDKCAEVEVHE